MSSASCAPYTSHCTPQDSLQSGCSSLLGTFGTSAVPIMSLLKQPTFLKPILARIASLTYISSISTRSGAITPGGSPLPPPDGSSVIPETPTTARRNALYAWPGSVLKVYVS